MDQLIVQFTQLILHENVDTGYCVLGHYWSFLRHDFQPRKSCQLRAGLAFFAVLMLFVTVASLRGKASACLLGVSDDYIGTASSKLADVARAHQIRPAARRSRVRPAAPRAGHASRLHRPGGGRAARRRPN